MANCLDLFRLFPSFAGLCCQSCHHDDDDGYTALSEREVLGEILYYCCAQIEAADAWEIEMNDR